MKTVRTIILDKTGTLTLGTPKLTEQHVAQGADGHQILGLVASLERYSKHPLASAILKAAREAAVPLEEGSEVREDPGRGLWGKIEGHEVVIGSRRAVMEIDPEAASRVPDAAAGLECTVAVDRRYVATYRFRDAPRQESGPFVAHLGKKHGVTRVLLVSGDRKSEVEYLATQVGIDETHAEKSPEEKVAIVSKETLRAPTLFIGDGINDAPDRPSERGRRDGSQLHRDGPRRDGDALTGGGSNRAGGDRPCRDTQCDSCRPSKRGTKRLLRGGISGMRRSCRCSGARVAPILCYKSKVKYWTVTGVLRLTTVSRREGGGVAPTSSRSRVKMRR